MKTKCLFLGLLLAAFVAHAQFSYYTNHNAIVITGYTNYGGAITIPSNINGLPVVAIQGFGFEDTGITSVTIPDTVTNIEAQSFSPNSTLRSFTVATNNPAYSSVGGVLFDKSGATLVEYPPGLIGAYTIPGSVTSVADDAFAATYSLTSVSLPTTVTNLGATAFGYCFSLLTFNIPASVTSIGPDEFLNCYNLTSINVATNNPAYASPGGVLFDKSETTLIDFPAGLGGTYNIPSGCTTIDTNAFFLCDYLTNVTFPPSVTTLDDGAFADCAFPAITLGGGVNYISPSAFSGNIELQAINVNSTNTTFSSLNGVLFNKNQTTLVEFPPGLTGGYTVPDSVTSVGTSAFKDSLVDDVIIPGNVAVIGELAFQGCGGLTNVTMSNGVASLGLAAFADCSELATVTIPASVTYLPANLFAYSGLVSVYFQGNEPGSDASAFYGDSATVYFLAGTGSWGPEFDGLTTVMEDAPNPNGALSITILPAGAAVAGAQWQVDGGLLQPSEATVVGLSVGQHTVSFAPLSGWTPPGNEQVSVAANTTNTATGTYSQTATPASDFTYLTNGSAITITGYIGTNGSVLTPTTINNLPVTEIGYDAFSGNTTVTSVTIADSVMNIGDFAFSSCTVLAGLTVSANVADIPFGLCEDCWSLTDVALGSNVTVISDFAFASCSALNTIALPNSLASVGENSFVGTALTSVTLPAAVTNVSDGAFLECFDLPAIGVSASNTTFASESGVLYTKDLSELVEYPDGRPGSSYVISNNVKTIAKAAFEYCNLASVTLPQGLTNIGDSAFEGSFALSGVVLPTNLLSVGDAAFGLCSSLTSINIPASVVNLGAVPFTACQSMTAITVDAGNRNYTSAGGALYNKSETELIEYPGGLTAPFAIPNSVGDIGAQALASCEITGLTIPASVTNIEIYGVYNCSYLTSVTIGDGLQNIASGAFEDCYALTNIVLPDTLTNIGDYAFAFSGNMAGAYFEGDALPDDSTVFFGENKMTVYYLPGSTGWGPTFGTAPTMMLPEITATAQPDSGPAPLDVVFNAATVNNWNWNFGDGATSTLRDPSHTYPAVGNYIVALVETNNAGLPMAGDSISISVTNNPAPRFSGLNLVGANISFDCSGGLAGSKYVVLFTTNLSMPLNQWQPVATNMPSASGPFSLILTNTFSPTNAAGFYVLQSP